MTDQQDDILDGLDEILGAAAEQPETPPVAPKRTRRTKAEMAAAAPAHAESALAATASMGAAMAAPPAAPPVKLDPLSRQHGFCGKKANIIIERSHDPQDPPTVFVKLNDYTCLITRGEPVEVPVEILGVLGDARQTVFSQPTEGVLVPHESLRFPYSRV